MEIFNHTVALCLQSPANMLGLSFLLKSPVKKRKKNKAATKLTQQLAWIVEEQIKGSKDLLMHTERYYRSRKLVKLVYEL